MPDNDFQKTVRVGLASCGVAAGAQKVHDFFQKNIQEKGVELKKTGCLGMCFKEPLVEVTGGTGSYIYGNVDVERARVILSEHIYGDRPVSDWVVVSDTGKNETESDFIKKQHRILLRNSGKIDPEDIGSFREAGGYTGLEKAVTQMSPREVIAEVEKSGLRGRGGAGFPAHLKWKFTLEAEGSPKYVVCNADEGDPGAFMDRSILESDPHSLVEGIIISAYAVGAERGYIYIRAEYPLAIKRLKIAIASAEERGYLGDDILGTGFSFHIELREGAGAFVCGEETALIASIEGRRGMPRSKPPFPAQEGLWGQPTLINNVETLANVSRVFSDGAGVYEQCGTEKSKGTKVFALAGKVRRGGLIEVPMGISINDIVFDIGGGISSGRPFKAVQIGGPSGGCIPAKMGDIPVDYESLKEIGAIMGSGGLIVMDEDTCMVDVARFFLNFTSEESCGKCTFCRIGTYQMLSILERISHGEGSERDLEVLEGLGRKIIAGSLCGLGQSAPNPVLTTIKYFRDEYEAHVIEKRCPAKKCKNLIEYCILEDKCIGCGACKRQCPVGAISGENKELHEINTHRCIKCGLCKNACKFDAVEVVSEGIKGAGIDAAAAGGGE